MSLIAAKCTQCGANIEVDPAKEAGICSHCGTAFITEKAINNYNISHVHNTNITNTTNIKDSVVNIYNDELNKFYVIEGTVLVKYNGKQSNFKVPDGITHIASHIFQEGWQPTSIFIPKSVVCIEKYAFSRVLRLDSLTFEEGTMIKKIDDSAFNSLTSDFIALPYGLEEIGQYAFQFIKTAYIPATVKKIGKGAFLNALALFTDSPEVPSGWSDIVGWSGNTKEKIITDVKPEDIRKKYGDFVYADTGKGAVIYDFTGGNNIVELPFEIDGKPVYRVFSDVYPKLPVNNTDEFEFKKGYMEVYPGWGYKHPQVKRVTFEEPSTVKVIGKKAFSSCKMLKSVKFSENLKVIGPEAFSLCIQLKDISLPKSVKRIESEAFYNIDIKTVYLRGNIEYIGERAFAKQMFFIYSSDDYFQKVQRLKNNLLKIVVAEGATIAHCEANAFNNRCPVFIVPKGFDIEGLKQKLGEVYYVEYDSPQNLEKLLKKSNGFFYRKAKMKPLLKKFYK